jgi:hypothetical protein
MNTNMSIDELLSIKPLVPVEIELSTKSYEERLSKFILRELKRQGRTKTWLAEKIQVGYKTFADRLNKGNITITELFKTCEALELDIDRTYRDTISPNRKEKFIQNFEYGLEYDIKHFNSYKSAYKELKDKYIVPQNEGRIFIIDDIEYRILFNYHLDSDEIEVFAFKIIDEEYYKSKQEELEDLTEDEDFDFEKYIEEKESILTVKYKMLYNKTISINYFDSRRYISFAFDAIKKEVGENFN